MSIVQMKTVNVIWSQIVIYETRMEVPVEYTNQDIEDAFWFIDLSGEVPVDYTATEIDFIETVD
jgi:hypothetical protein